VNDRLNAVGVNDRRNADGESDLLNAGGESENLRRLEQVAEMANEGRGKVIEAGGRVNGKVERREKGSEREGKLIVRTIGGEDVASGRRKESAGGKSEGAESAKEGTEESAIAGVTAETENEGDGIARERQSPNPLQNQKPLRQTQLKFSAVFKKRRCAGRVRSKKQCSASLTRRKRKERPRRKDSV